MSGCSSNPQSATDEQLDQRLADNTPSQNDSDALLLWVDPNLVPALELVAPQFKAATGLDLNLDVMPIDDIRVEITKAESDGATPDLFAGRHWWTGQLVEDNLIVPVELWSIEPQIITSLDHAFEYQGLSYGLPYSAESLILYRNTDMVPDAPESFDQMTKYCAANSLEMCLAMPGGNQQGDAYHHYPFVSAFGGYAIGYSPVTGFNGHDFGLGSESTIQGLEYLKAMVESGTIAPLDYEQAKAGFVDAKAPFYLTGPWEHESVTGSGVPFAVSVIPPIGDQPAQPFVEAEGLFVSARSQQKLEAVSLLLDHLASEPAMEAVLAASPRATPWASLASRADASELQTVLNEAVANAALVPNLAGIDALWQPLGEQLLAIRKGERSPRRAMDTMQDVYSVINQ